MRIPCFLLFMMFFLPVLFAGEWKLERPRAGYSVLSNDNGQWAGIRQVGLSPLGWRDAAAKKVIDLSKLPEGMVSSARSAYLRIHLGISEKPGDKFPGLRDRFAISVNGREMIFSTSDPSFAHYATTGEKNRRNGFVDIPFPVGWLNTDKLEVVLRKKTGSSGDDVIAVGIDDSTTPNSASFFSFHGGRKYQALGQGEYMIRLVIDESGGELPGEPQSSSDYFCNFSENIDLPELSGSAKIADGELHFDGGKGSAFIPGGESFHLTDHGATLLAVLRFNRPGPDQLKKNTNMMLFHKDNAFFLGRTGNLFNFSLSCNNQLWSEAMIGGETPDIGQWFHLAATIERINEPEQSNVGYLLKIFLNGELHQQKMIRNAVLDHSTSPLEIGRGLDGYEFFGDIAELGTYHRAFSAEEISCLAAVAPLVKIQRPGEFSLPEGVAAILAAQEARASTSFGRWLIDSLARAGKTGADAGTLETTAGKLPHLDLSASPEEIASAFNAAQPHFVLYLSAESALLLDLSDSGRNYPIAGWFDRHAGVPVFGKRTFQWGIKYQDNRGNHQSLEYYSNTLQRKARKIDPSTWLFAWQNADLRIESRLHFSGSRLSTSFEVSNLSDQLQLNEVIYPSWSLAKKSGSVDKLVIPHMSGIVETNPTSGFSIANRYPACRMAMNFCAYYDETGNGVYFACEDPRGRSRDFSLIGKNHQLDVQWQSSVARSAGNSYLNSGEAVLELYRGDWFEAGQIYKRFVRKKADWWIEELPRRTTPQWYRENPMIMICGTGPNELYLRKYFDIDFVAGWGPYLEVTDEDYPRYLPLSGAGNAALQQFHSAGMRVSLYFNPHLWGFRPRLVSHWQERTGARAAVRQSGGEPLFETYGSHYAVICPGSEIAANWILDVTRSIAEYGFDEIYHDQLPAAKPQWCFATDHSHAPADPALWLEKGYWPIYEKLRAQASAINPNIVHSGEDAAEVYLRCLDSFACWRWIDPNKVPLFQSVYAGRIQFTGRIYDMSAPGSYESFFAKMGEQLVYGEQVGWFQGRDMYYASPRRLYAKKLAHLRHALARTFLNESDMLPFLKFKEAVPQLTTLWGGTGNTIPETTDKVLHSVWKRIRDGQLFVIFLNTVNEKITLEPLGEQLPAGRLVIGRESASPMQMLDFDGQNVPQVTLEPYAAEIWMLGNKDANSEFAEIDSVLKKIHAFTDPGVALALPQDFKACKKITAGLGQWVMPQQCSWMKNSHMPVQRTLGYDLKPDSESWIQADAGGEVFFGEVDFADGATGLELKTAADSSGAGGSVEFYVSDSAEASKRLLARFVTPVTGDWFDFKTLKTRLEFPVKGKYLLSVHFKELGCNIRSWRLTQD